LRFTPKIPKEELQRAQANKVGRRKSEKADSTGIPEKRKYLEAQVSMKLYPVSNTTLFETKYLFHGEKPDSFLQLLESPREAKQYILDLNRRIFNGKILPFKKSHVDSWLKDTDDNKTILLLIDSEMEALNEEVQQEKAESPKLNIVRWFIVECKCHCLFYNQFRFEKLLRWAVAVK
jgi:hypothetical protein